MDQNSLENVIYRLLQTEPFFAHFILSLKIEFDTHNVPTMGVSVQNGQINLVINSTFLSSLTLLEQCACLKHEIMHLLLEHCTSRLYGAENLMTKNIAMDCAINQHISDLPDGGITLVSLQKILKMELAPEETWEYYYEKMKQSPEVQKVPQPNHEFMNKADEDSSTLSKEAQSAIDQLFKAAVKDAANKAAVAAAGNVPEHVSKLLGQLNKAAVLPWKQLLRNLIASSKSVEHKNTRMRVNRRFGLDVPGKKKLRRLKLAVCCDSSGSVSDEAYTVFMTEIVAIAKETTSTWLIDADCVVQNIIELKNGVVPAKAKKRHGAGGTAYQPAITAALTKGVDAIVYFGDMDSADVPTNPGVPFIWAAVGQQEPPGNFGHTLRLPI